MHTHTHKHTHMHECWNASIIFIHHRRLHECQERVQDLPVIVITNMVPRTLKDLKSAIHTAQTRLQRAHSISTITAIWLIPLAHTANHCWQIRKRTSLTWQAISITHWQTADFFSLFCFFCFFCFVLSENTHWYHATKRINCMLRKRSFWVRWSMSMDLCTLMFKGDPKLQGKLAWKQRESINNTICRLNSYGCSINNLSSRGLFSWPQIGASQDIAMVVCHLPLKSGKVGSWHQQTFL